MKRTTFIISMNMAHHSCAAAVLGSFLFASGCGGTPPATTTQRDSVRVPLSVAAKEVKFQLIRNATIKLDYAGTTFLVDPMLAARGGYPGFEGTVRSDVRFPLVDLPVPLDEVLIADAVILTHLHDDHWDEVARRLVPRDMPIFVQNEDDAAKVRADGFSDVRVLPDEGSEFNGTRLYRTGGQHGTETMYAVAPVGELLGSTMGVVFQRPHHSTVYVAGDTVWNRHVEDVLSRYKPDVVALNAGYAQLSGFEGSIIMGKEDVLRAHEALRKATIVAIHMEAVNHATLSRASLRAFIEEGKLASDRALVPENGQSYLF